LHKGEENKGLCREHEHLIAAGQKKNMKAERKGEGKVGEEWEDINSNVKLARQRTMA